MTVAMPIHEAIVIFIIQSYQELSWLVSFFALCLDMATALDSCGYGYG